MAPSHPATRKHRARRSSGLAVGTTTLTSKGQITLPRAVARALNLKRRDTFLLDVDEEGQIVAVRARTRVEERARSRATTPKKKEAPPA